MQSFFAFIRRLKMHFRQIKNQTPPFRRPTAESLLNYTKIHSTPSKLCSLTPRPIRDNLPKPMKTLALAADGICLAVAGRVFARLVESRRTHRFYLRRSLRRRRDAVGRPCVGTAGFSDSAHLFVGGGGVQTPVVALGGRRL